ncbi:sulfurtransferase [Leucobacter sp.]
MRPADALLFRPGADPAAATPVFVEVVPWRTQPGDASLSAPTIPGAHRAGVRTVFAGVPRPGTGHLPLPDPACVRATAARWRAGVPAPRDIVLFTRRAEDLTSATRAWFILSWAGVDGVRVMLGGLPAWVATGGALGGAARDPASRTPRPKPRIPHRASTGPPPAHERAGARFVQTLDADGAAEVAVRGTLLDARPAEHYAGFLDDERSGHVPGAVSAPASDLLAAEGSLLSPPALRRWFLEHGAIGSHPVAAYCHGGVASSSLVFAAALLGQRVDLYVDSWSAWATDPDRPVAHGAERGATTGPDVGCLDPLTDAR